jgi:uncharacterized protein (DUF1015 family)
MRISPFKAVYADISMIASPQSFYDTVKEEYQDYKKSDFFRQSAQLAYYIYEIKTKDRMHLGLVTCVDIDEYTTGHIMKHEHTLAEKEQKMMNLLIQRKAMIKPVLLTYPPNAELKIMLLRICTEQKPFYHVKFDQSAEIHKIWAVNTEGDIETITRIFNEQIPIVYIADGHHRCSAALHIHKSLQKRKKNEYHFDQLLSVFFDFDELIVLDYNRVVDAFEDISPVTFMAKLSGLFDIEILPSAAKPTSKHEITMCIGREWYLLKWKNEVLKSTDPCTIKLDTALLDREVFQDILGFEDVRSDSRIDYVEGIRDLDYFQHRVLKKRTLVGFCLFPIELNEVCQIADAGEYMPPKSTWFEPRIKNGMLIHEL